MTFNTKSRRAVTRPRRTLTKTATFIIICVCFVSFALCFSYYLILFRSFRCMEFATSTGRTNDKLMQWFGNRHNEQFNANAFPIWKLAFEIECMTLRHVKDGQRLIFFHLCRLNHFQFNHSKRMFSVEFSEAIKNASNCIVGFYVFMPVECWVFLDFSIGFFLSPESCLVNALPGR